jgi:hypothetical protein
MHSVDLIASALGAAAEPLPCEPVEGVCCVTGSQGPCMGRKHLIGKSFTNLDLLAAPNSDLVGVPAYRALSYKWERMSSWFCDGVEFRKLTRQDVRALVLSGEYEGPWSGYATTSYKKHGVLRTPVNSSGKRVWLFEMVLADCSDHDRLLLIWERLNRELRSGFSRSVMESLEPNQFTLKEVGYSRWRDFERWARPMCRGPLYQFLCYLLPSMEELKDERKSQVLPEGQDARAPRENTPVAAADRGLFDEV